MPGVLPGPDREFFHRIAELERNVRAIATQQNQWITNAQDQPILTIGLIPGSNPAQYGLQLLDPSTGNQLAFLGENAAGAAVFNITGTETVSGTLNVSGTETVSGTLNVTGNMIVGGTLSLPNGIINNAALANPVAFGVMNATVVHGLTFTATAGVMASGTIAIPSGFSQAAVLATGWCRGTASGSLVAGITSAFCTIGSSSGPSIAGTDTTGGGTTLYCDAAPSHSTLLTGLSGGNITVSISVAASNTATGTGDALVSAIAVFAR